MGLLLEKGSDSAKRCSTGQMYSAISNDPEQTAQPALTPTLRTKLNREVGEVGGAISKKLFANSMKQTVIISIYMFSGSVALVI